jgi:hypothetical protein
MAWELEFFTNNPDDSDGWLGKHFESHCREHMQCERLGNRWKPPLGYFYHLPLPIPPCDISLTLQASFPEFFQDILMGGGWPKGMAM